MKGFIWAVSAALVTSICAPALAQLAGLNPAPLPMDAAKAIDVQRGAAVLDPGGGGGARIVSIDGDRVTIATSKSRVMVPVSALRKRSGDLTLSMPIADLDAVAARRTEPLKAIPALQRSPTLNRIPAPK